MTISQSKKDARDQAFVRRKQAFDTVSYDITAAILQSVQSHQVIACYMPMRTEINPLGAMQALVEAGKHICVPIIQGKAQPLRFYEWTPDCALIEGEFGALIPKDTPERIPDFVLAPMVAFDEHGTRLGYGGGFYDRTLERLRKSKPTPYVGLAFEAQKSPEPLPMEPTDIPLDGIITEQGYRAF